MTSSGVATTASSSSLPLAANRAFENQSRSPIVASDPLLQFCHVRPVSPKDSEGGGRRDEGQHGGDENPGQLSRVPRAQAAEGIYAASSSAATAAGSAGSAAGPTAAAGALETKGTSAEETKHSGGARGEIGDENPGGNSWLPGAEEAAGRSGSGNKDPGWLPWLQDAEVAEAERPIGCILWCLVWCRRRGDVGRRCVREHFVGSFATCGRNLAIVSETQKKTMRAHVRFHLS
ncbi:hypothetical protein P5V15_000671 [Pogonomyrmex californicus]